LKRKSERFPHRSPDFIGPQEVVSKRTTRLNRKSNARYNKENSLKIANRKLEIREARLSGKSIAIKNDDITFHTISDKEFEAMEKKERDDRKQELKEYRNKPVWKPKRAG
jgi:hypothetical protein